MEVILGGQPNAASRKLTIDTRDSANSLGENPRKEQTVVRMGHGVGSGIPHTVGVRFEVVQVCVLDDMVWETHYQNTRQK